MSDIVERLRSPSKGSPTWMDTMAEAADEIERLRAELKRTQDELDFADCEVEHFARLAFDDLGKNPPEAWVDIAASLRAELATARREERERCAVEIEGYAREVKDHGSIPVDPYEAAAQVLHEAASAIRAMGDE